MAAGWLATRAGCVCVLDAALRLNWKAGCVDEQQVVEEAPEAKDSVEHRDGGAGWQRCRACCAAARCVRGCATWWWRLRFGIHISFSVPAGAGGRHQHAAAAGGPGPAFHQQNCVSVGEIHQGDVVVFEYPRDHTKSYIKRVIALPGDRLRIDHGTVYVNGVAPAGALCAESLQRRPV